MKRNDTACDCNIIHRDVVDRVSKTMPREETLYDLAELFKVFGDSTRIKILCPQAGDVRLRYCGLLE